MKYNKLINNLSDINSAFSKLTSEEMIAIEQVSQNQNISDDEWQNILKKAKKSQPLLLSLCYFDNYNQNIVQKLIDMLPTDSLTYVLHKNNIDISSVKYVCSKIKNTDLKEYIENNSDNISEIFKNEILNFDYEKSQAINFAQYQFFRGIDVQATQMIELYPTDENFMTAISNNKYLDDKIRNDAFNNMHNPSLIENYTNYMKMKMYHNAAIRLFDYPQKSVMDIEKNEEAKEVILKLIEKRELPLSCEYDLLQRLQDMPSLHYCGILLNTMLKHTHDAIILKKAYEFNPQTTEHIIENNPHCDIFTVEKFINKSVRKMKEFSKSNSLIPLLKEKDIVYTKIFSQPLSLESYKKIHQYAKTNDQLLDYAILVSPYININSIKDLFQNNKSPMVAFREQLQHQFAQHGISEKRCFEYLNFAVYCLFKDDEEYFKHPQSLSLNHFFKHFGIPFQNISLKEMEIVNGICQGLQKQGDFSWIKEFDKQIKKIYNIENEFGPYAKLYHYHEGKLCFDIAKFSTLTPHEKENIIFDISNNNNLNSLETLQESIENELVQKGLSVKTYLLMTDIINMYNKILDKIKDIEKTIEDREEYLEI